MAPRGFNTMADLEQAVLALLNKKTYQPLKPKALARKLDVPVGRYAEFRKVLRALLKQGVIVRPLHGFGAANAIRVTVGTRDEHAFLSEALGRIGLRVAGHASS